MNWIASIAMNQAETIRSRLKVADAIFDRLLEQSKFDEEWKELNRTLRSRARERNVVVHGDWAVAEELDNAIINVDYGDKSLYWTLADFEAVVSRIGSLNLALNKFQNDVLDAIHDKVITRYITPDMIMDGRLPG